MSKLIKWYRQHRAEVRAYNEAYNDLLAEVHGLSRLDREDRIARNPKRVQDPPKQ